MSSDPVITLTSKAADYIKRLLAKENIACPPGGIRFQIKAGGCHGLEFIHNLELTDKHHDLVVLSREVRIIIDPKSMKILNGSEIDHSENLLEKSLFIKNDRFKTCGCGTSFEPPPENK